jgi:hypothetical protein
MNLPTKKKDKGFLSLDSFYYVFQNVGNDSGRSTTLCGDNIVETLKRLIESCGLSQTVIARRSILGASKIIFQASSGRETRTSLWPSVSFASIMGGFYE